MKTIEIGRKYEVSTAEGHKAFDIVFCHKEEGKFIDGITNEELVEVLLHRLEFLAKQKMSTDNINAFTHMQQVKNWIHSRNYKKLRNSKTSIHDNSRNGIRVQAES